MFPKPDGQFNLNFEMRETVNLDSPHPVWPMASDEEEE
jgi:hypothetical protein